MNLLSKTISLSSQFRWMLSQYKTDPLVLPEQVNEHMRRVRQTSSVVHKNLETGKDVRLRYLVISK